MSLDEAVEALGDPSTETILALVQRRQQWRNEKGKRPFKKNDRAKQDGRPQRDPKPRGEAADRKIRCANCGREGHDKDSCRKPKVELSKRPCFVCGEVGHVARLCPKKQADANELDEEGDDDDEIAAMIYDDTDLESEGWPEVEDEFVAMPT